ncbi:MAG: SgcJ/EcaC family oxidoreductase [Actinophytocola sp.]|uniref:SgcJ/EcaC family oxidoreductase n=1 Tax=Actinophytocola sp. TaxID=1872138 RepID=UPI001326AF78|nr:SgcJ/EcaC family oxidoreductase [Actinophytocola sp.]MPZ83967.1 SgcJ/EcaC family oxidoreductase [Actinophytocola sp.]
MTNTLVQDDSAVRAVLDGVYAAWAAGDADAFVAGYAEDATAVLPGTFLPGKAAVRAAMAAMFAGPLKGSYALHEVRSVRFLDGAAIVVSKGGVVPAGQTTPAEWAVETRVLAASGGEWLVKAFHNCPACRRPTR